MNCQELLSDLCDYLDDDLRRELCKEIEEHMIKCPDCKIHVDTMRGTVALVRDLGECHCAQEVVVRLKTRIFGRIDPHGTA